LNYDCVRVPQAEDALADVASNPGVERIVNIACVSTARVPDENATLQYLLYSCFSIFRSDF